MINQDVQILLLFCSLMIAVPALTLAGLVWAKRKFPGQVKSQAKKPPSQARAPLEQADSALQKSANRLITSLPFRKQLEAMDPVVRTFIGGALLIIASIAIFSTFWDSTDSASRPVSIWDIVAFVLLLVGVNSLWQLIFGETFLNASSVVTGFLGAGTSTIAKCGRCGRKLGGKEYRDQLRFGFCTCPQCGARLGKTRP